jgi:hypothetical protein
MHRRSSKLPRWQNRDNSPYMRRGLLKRYRGLIVFALLVFVWQRYSPLFKSRGSESEESISSNLPNLSDLNSPSLLKTRNTVKEIAPISPLLERERRHDSKEALQTSLEQVSVETISESKETGNRAGQSHPVAQEEARDDAKSNGSPTNAGNDPQVLVLKNSDSEHLKEEPEDDEVPEKSVPLTKSKAKANTESSVDNDPLLPGREASQRIIEQPSSLKVEDFEQPSKPPQSLTGPRRFPSYSEYLELSEKAESLPDIIHVTFEEATEDVTLVGWEDSWFSDAEFDVQKWGSLSEPKIDFVYTCKARKLKFLISAYIQRGQWLRGSISGDNFAIRTKLHFER